MRVVYNKLSKEIISVIADDSSITSFPTDYAVIQGDEDEVSKIASVIGLDISQISSTMTEELKKVYQNKNFGNSLINRFLEENERIAISTADNLSQLQAFQPIMTLLETGSIGTARDVLEQIPVEAFVIVPPYQSQQERKDSFLNDLNTYLNS